MQQPQFSSIGPVPQHLQPHGGTAAALRPGFAHPLGGFPGTWPGSPPQSHVDPGPPPGFPPQPPAVPGAQHSVAASSPQPPFQDPLTRAFWEIATLRRHPFFTQLWNAREGGKATDRTKEITNPQWIGIEMWYRQYLTELQLGSSPEQAFNKSMVSHGRSCSPVIWAFRECLQPGSVDFTKVPNGDLREIAKEYSTYQFILGNFMPSGLSNLVAPVLAELAFDVPTTETSRHRNDVQEYIRRLNFSRQLGGGNVGIPSGYQPLDDLFAGFNGTTIVGGNAGTGKTDFLISCVAHILSTASDVAVLLVSADLSKQRMFDRLMCCLAQITEAELNHASRRKEHSERLEDAVALLTAAAARFQIVEVNDSKPFDTNEVLQLRDCLIEGSRCKRLLIVVDYLQVLRFDSPKGDLHESERHRFSEIKRLAKPSPIHRSLGEFSLAIISEVRKGDGNGGLELEDLSGSARHYYGADSVLLLEPSAEGEASAESESVSITVSVKKARRGHKGQLALTFDYPRHSFRFKAVTIEAGTKPKRPRPGASST